MECPRCHDIDVAPQECFQVEQQSCGKPRARCYADISEQIEVTLWRGFITSHRTKHANSVCPMRSGNAPDRLTFFVEKLFECDRPLLESASRSRHKGLLP